MAGVLDSNQRKAVLVVILLVVAAGIAYWQWPFGRSLPEQVNFVCVATGATFSLSRDNVRRIPAANPETGEYTLLPCVDEGGVLRVDGHYYEAVLGLADQNRYVDPNTLVVEPQGPDVQ